MNPAHSAAISATPASLAFGVVMGFLPGERLPPSVPPVVRFTNHTRAGVPDNEDAVYHPAMAALKWTAVALVAMLAFPAHADVSGPACVTDGDTLVVNGKRQRTRCVGGTRVRLFGIDAPGDCVTFPTANDPT